uniref:Uncharacterized protein n=1 Tax=Rhizophora mucronata TaxID=61149 RepID=A0A2P2QS15_RHIMU
MLSQYVHIFLLTSYLKLQMICQGMTCYWSSALPQPITSRPRQYDLTVELPSLYVNKHFFIQNDSKNFPSNRENEKAKCLNCYYYQPKCQKRHSEQAPLHHQPHFY